MRKKDEDKLPSVFKRRLNYGIGYVLMIIAVLVAFVLVNVILERLPMSLDFSPNEQFSITSETDKILDSLKEDVEIIALYDRVRGMADSKKSEVIRILDLYDAYEHIKVSYVSLNDNPNIVNEKVNDATAATYAEGDYIVKSSRRTKRIPADDMFTTETYYISNIIPVQYATGNQTELKVSTAINYVTLDIIPNLYISTGLNEDSKDLYSKIFEDLDNMNINTKDINLSQIDSIPEDAGAILFLSPKRDLSAKEYDMLHQYLYFDGGMAFFAFDSDKTAVEMERFNLLFSELYGISINNDIVSDEESYQITAAARPSVITASSQNNGPLSANHLNKTFISYDSRSITLLSTVGYFNSYSLITTSSTGKSTTFGSGEETVGVKTLAACGENTANKENSKVVVLGSSRGLTDQNIQTYSDTSSELLFLYSIDWMMGEDTMEPLEINAKEYVMTTLTTESRQSKVIFTFAVIIYPLAIIAVGVIIWLRRRHL